MRRSIRLLPLGATAGLSSSACATFPDGPRPYRSTARPRLSLALLAVAILLAYKPGARAADLPLLVNEDFENGSARWQATDNDAWRIAETPRGKVFSLFRQSQFKPPHRSPVNFALLKDVIVSDFVLEAQVQSTIKDYDHRDMVLVFGYQDPAHFYYVHFGKKTDDHANQIFIVNDAPRVKISTQTTPGTPWDDEWHRLKVVRTVADGNTAVYFDDLDHPAMTATDKTFAWGQLGIGSFDDQGNYDNVVVHGTLAKPTR